MNSSLTPTNVTSTDLQGTCSLFIVWREDPQNGFTNDTMWSSPTPIDHTPESLFNGIRRQAVKASKLTGSTSKQHNFLQTAVRAEQRSPEADLY